MNTRQFFASLLAAFSVSIASGADFTPFLGEWSYDEDLTYVEQLRVAKSPSQTIFAERLVSTYKALVAEEKLPAHSNIRVSKSRIVGIDGLLQPQYDLLSAEDKEDVVIARVRHHEDRHDPGDSADIELHLRLKGDRLILEQHIGELPVELVFAFKRK